MKCGFAEWLMFGILIAVVIPLLGYIWMLFISELKDRFFK